MISNNSLLNHQAVAASEKRLRALLIATSDVIYSVSADWEIMRELDGRGFLIDTNEPITGWKARNVFPGDRAMVDKAIEKAIHSKSIFKLEYRVLRADGMPGWTFSRAVPVLDDENNIIEWFGVASDITESKRAEEALKLIREESELQRRVYETITSNTPDLMYVFDLNYRFTYVNSALLSMWGKTWNTAVGKGLRENGYEEWHAAMHEREIDFIRVTKQPVRGEVSFPHATLGKRVYDYILTPIFNEHGEVEGVAGTTRDVTDRKKIEDVLAQTTKELQAINDEMAFANKEQLSSNEKLLAANEELALVNEQLREARKKIDESEVALRLAISAADFGTWFIHSETREFITDARLKELFGYYPDEDFSIQQALTQILDEYRGFVAIKLENAIYNGGDYDVTYPVIGLHDQRLRWLRAIGNLKADLSGAFSAFTGVVMDITEQHLAAKKIEDSEKHFRHLADLVPVKISNALPNREVTFFNQQWLDYAGMNFEDLRDFGYHQLMHPDDIQVFQKQLDEAAVKGMPVESEIRFKDKNGQYRWHLNLASPILNEKFEIILWIGSTIDIQRIKEEDQRKSDFIGMVSHELKTPLTSLNMILQVAHSKLKSSDDEFLAGAMSRAVIQAKRMSNLINGFLNISRLESGKILIEKSRFDLAALLQEIVDEARVSNTHQISVEGCPAEVHADREKINSVITNLVSNAIKYSPKGTIIWLGCRRDDNYVTVSVKDEGIGVNKEDTLKIFERYYRVENSQMQHISGFGIGLYLSADIVRRHDGQIWVERNANQGSTLHFRYKFIT